MSTNLPAITETTPEGHGHDDPALPVTQADTDAQLVDLWVRRHDSPNTRPNTRRNYRRQAERFMAWIGKPLGVWSRDEVVRVDLERSRVLCPGLADRLERGSPLEPLEVLGEVVGRDKGQDMSLQALQVGGVKHLDGRILQSGS